MRRVFADSLYWIALSHPRDQWHSTALKASQLLKGVEIVTTQEVLSEFLTAFRSSEPLRRLAARRVHQIASDPQVRTIPQSDHSFQAGLQLYQARPDKQYSLADCVSMTAMRLEGLSEVLTHDQHFSQEGFTLLM